MSAIQEAFHHRDQQMLEKELEEAWSRLLQDRSLLSNVTRPRSSTDDLKLLRAWLGFGRK